MSDLDTIRLATTARRWRLRRVSIFGSVARGDDNADRDLDLLIDFGDADDWSLLDVARLKVELEEATQRQVDIVEDAALVNPYRRRAILRDATPVCVAE